MPIALFQKKQIGYLSVYLLNTVLKK